MRYGLIWLHVLAFSVAIFYSGTVIKRVCIYCFVMRRNCLYTGVGGVRGCAVLKQGRLVCIESEMSVGRSVVNGQGYIYIYIYI